MAKSSKKVVQVSELRLAGPEPESQIVVNDFDLMKCLNWYNRYYNQYEAIPFLITYMKEQKFLKSEIEAVSKTEPWRIPFNIMTRARMMSRGLIFQDEMKARFDLQLRTAIDEVLTKARYDEENKVVKIPTYTALDRVLEHIGQCEEALDEFMVNGSSDFSAYNFFKSENVIPKTVSRISERYRRIIEELNDKDPEVIRSMKPRQMKAYIAFIQKIIDDCDAYTNTRKAAKTITKVPRKRKEKTADQLTSHIRFMKESSEFKIASISPSSIIGAKELWLFNTRSRNLFVYHAEADKELAVHGQKLMNIDVEKSNCKILRKPETILPQVNAANKTALKRLMESVAATPKKGNARFDEFMIILKAFK